jgi:hypothetical protein
MGLPMSRLLERRLVRIPVERLNGLSAVWYQSTGHWLNSRPGDTNALRQPPDSDFSPFDAGHYRELAAVPAKHERYLRSQLRRGEPALGFVFIPHVLVQGRSASPASNSRTLSSGHIDERPDDFAPSVS